MITDAGAVKTRVLREIDRRQDEFVDLCCRIVRFNTENPPGGNTAEAAAFIGDLLRRRRLAVQMVEPQAGVVSLTATLAGRRASPHFVLNGHLDVFPADDPGLWDYPPFCGEVRNGKILGRGVADMKAGTTASLCAFLVAADLSLDLPGRLTLTIVSDEAAGFRDIALTLVTGSMPNYTSPTSLLAQMVSRNAAAVRGETPSFTMTTAGTDGRFYRARGVPTVIYGPRRMTLPPSTNSSQWKNTSRC